MWSKGNTPFSGGTGLNPLFPPNEPPANNFYLCKNTARVHEIQQVNCERGLIFHSSLDVPKF